MLIINENEGSVDDISGSSLSDVIENFKIELEQGALPYESPANGD